MDPIRIFVGTDVNGGCAECQMVFEYSLQKHCKVPYELTWMKISDDPNSFWYGWNTQNWSTPFSGFRYGIAEYCNYEGKAIYCDDDQLWLASPELLWHNGSVELDAIPEAVMTGKQLANGEIRHCVSLIACDKFKQFPPVSRRKQLPNFCELYKDLTFPKTRVISDAWNCYDGEDRDIKDIGLLHFTDMSTNPGVALAVQRLGSQSRHWYTGQIREHRRPDVKAVFHQYYDEALAAGFKVEDYISDRKISYQMLDQKNYRANNGWDVLDKQ
jgi:hypothetical protein